MATSPGPGLSRLLMSSPLSRSRKLPVFPLPAPGAELAPPVLPVTAPPPSRFWKFMFPPMPVPLNRSWSVPSPPDVPARVPVPVGVAGLLPPTAPVPGPSEPLPADVLLVPGEAVAVPEVPEPGDAVVSDVTPLPEEVTDAPLPDDAPDDVPDDAPDDVPDDAPDDVPDDAPDDVPDDAPDDVADDVPNEALEAVEVSGGVADVVPGEASAEVPVVDDELEGELVVTDPMRDMAALTEKYTVT